MQLKTRFPEDHPALQLQEILPPQIVEMSNDTFKKTVDCIIEAAKVYEEDLHSIDSLRSELKLWRRKISKEEPEDPNYGFHMKELFKLTSDFPNVQDILRLLMTLPATSCAAERAFSTLKRVKSDRRSTMGEERLEALMLISMHGQGRLNVDKAVDKFMKLQSRRC